MVVKTVKGVCPTAKIAVNNNLVKTYKDNIVYLNDKQNFQIELFNPLSIEVLAKIKIQNEEISSSGLVLRPGERIFLDRYLDESRKFKFDVYYIGNDPATKAAISANGKIEVEFYKKEEIINLGTGQVVTFYNDFTTNPPWVTPNTNPYTINYTDASFNIGDAISHTLTSGDLNFQTDNLNETGRIGKGEESQQEFENITMEFSSVANNSVNLTILPTSLKSKQTKEIRIYCEDCGARVRKKSAKFCRDCGSKL